MPEPNDQQVHVSFASERDDGAFWQVTSFTLDEAFNRPYSIDLDLRSFDFAGDLSAMLGARAEVTIERGGLRRPLYGILDAVETGPLVSGLVTARVRCSPALVALQHRRNSRVFTDLSVVDVLREVIQPTLHAFGRDVDLGWLTQSYPARAYVTQYQESDYAFVSRLMEDEGIAYRFVQDSEAGVETLVLLDDGSGYAKLSTASGPDGMLPMVAADGGSDQREDLRSFTRKVALGPNRARAATFDWGLPDEDRNIGGDGDALGANATGPELEHYDFEPAPEGAGAEAIERKLKLQRRRLRQAAQKFVARTTATGITVGSTFEVVDHPDLDLNGNYLVTAVKHRMSLEVDDRPFVGAPIAGGSAVPEQCSFDNECECQLEDEPFVPVRTTKRPFVPGVVAGTVVSDWADEKGRVTVKLHWDRGDTTSCPLRVVQPWAGQGWGTQFFPRAGMLVYVSFVNGDPDHPIVIGAAYSGETPYKSADHQSGIKTAGADSTDYYNELMFDDTPGAELIRIRGERDIYTHALQAHHVDVGTDETTRVHGIQDTTVDGDRVATYQANQRITVGKERRLTVRGDEVRTVEGSTYETFHQLLMRTTHGDLSDTVSKGSATYTVAKSQMTVTGENLFSSCGGDRSDETAGTHRIRAATELDIYATKMRVLAPGGVTIIGPTEETSVFNSRSQVAQSLLETLAVSTSIASVRMSIALAAIATGGFSASGYKISTSLADLSMSTARFALTNRGLALATGQFSITAVDFSVVM